MGTCGGSSRGQRGSTGGEWAPLTPSGPPHRVTPPGQGGVQILAAATLADVAVVDVPVYMLRKFQQSLVLRSVHQQSGGYSSWYTETGMHSVILQKTVEIPQLQFLDLVVVPGSCNDKFGADSAENCGIAAGAAPVCCGRPCDHAARSSSPVARFSRDSVRQSAGHSSYAHSAVLEQGCCVVVYDRCPWFDSTEFVHRQGRRHPWFRTVAVPQIQSSTVLNDVFEAVLAYFSDSPRKGLSPGLRGFFEPSMTKSSSSSRAPWGWR